MITASLKTPEWNTDMGVIKQESGEWDKSDDGLGFKLIYVRYLQKVHPWLNDQKVKDAIVQYVNIQYDSLVWLASDSAVKPVNFGRSWDGNGGKGYQGSTVHSQM
jgi:predicted alpha-1,6-mannanase (GH76 family)